MSAQVVRIREAACEAGAAIPRAALDQLHGLLKLDPIAGTSPARAVFVVSDSAKIRLAHALAAGERELALRSPACALIGYDFPFAVSLMLSGSYDRSVAILTAARSASLQGECLQLAARAVGLETLTLAHFDAAALRTAFLPGSQATIVHLCALASAASA